MIYLSPRYDIGSDKFYYLRNSYPENGCLQIPDDLVGPEVLNMPMFGSIGTLGLLRAATDYLAVADLMHQSLLKRMQLFADEKRI